MNVGSFGLRIYHELLNLPYFLVFKVHKLSLSLIIPKEDLLKSFW